MYSGLYLTVGQGTKNGVPIVSHEFPLAWDVQDANKNTPEVKSVSRLPVMIQMLSHIGA